MNDISQAVWREQKEEWWKPIPRIFIFILIPLLFFAILVSIFILVAVHKLIFFLCFLALSSLIVSFLLWNRLNWSNRAALFRFLHSFPDSDLVSSRHAQLVKITGLVSCGSVSLESSYERATRCIYTSTLLYEYVGCGLRRKDANTSCFQWNLTYCERFSTDFYITDRKSGIRALVKAGPGCKVVPLIGENKLVATTTERRILSPHLKKWLRERNLSVDARLLRLEEGYVQEGSIVSVIGMLHKDNGILIIVEPPELLSTGCFWKKLLLPVEIDGLVLGMSDIIGSTLNPGLR
ncbi:Ubiquitin-specific protease family C19-related protein [Euphorbia peplus]|nr:Ubiquitin-specific protease family C19-related protein [Euphorbia peplus]